MKSYLIYIAECADGTLYTGITVDLYQRLRAHNGHKNGGALYTSWRRPIGIRYTEKSSTRGDAMKRELQLKKLSRAKKVSLCENTTCSLRFREKDA